MPCTITRRRRVRISMKPEQVFNRFQRVVCSVARRIAKRTGRPYYEMTEEAISKLGEMSADWRSVLTFDPKRGVVPCTWIYAKVYYHLLNLCDARLRRREIDFPNSPDLDTYTHRPSWFERIASELSSEAVAIIRIVLEAPSEMVRDFMRKKDPARARVALVNHLHQLGWSDEKIDAAWNEVQACLN